MPRSAGRKLLYRLKKTLQFVAGFLLAVALLALSLGVRVSFAGGVPVVSTSTDLGQVWRLTLASSPWGIAASIVVGVFAHNLLRALRWRIMLSPEKPGIGLYNLTSTTIIGYAVSWALPFRVGEVLRPMLLAEREKIRVSSAITTIVVERFLDGLAVVALFAVCLSFWDGRAGLSAPGEAILGFARKASVVMLAGSLVLFGLLVTGAITRSRWKARVEAFAASTHSRFAASAARAAIGLVEGGVILTRPVGFAAVAVLSLAIWIVIGWSTWVGFAASGVKITFAETFILMPATVLGIGMPTPGGAGSYEYFVSQTLHHLFRQPIETALAATLVMHVVITIIPVVLTGIFLLWRDGVTPARLRVVLARAGGGPAGPDTPSGPPARPLEEASS